MPRGKYSTKCEPHNHFPSHYFLYKTSKNLCLFYALTILHVMAMQSVAPTEPTNRPQYSEGADGGSGDGMNRTEISKETTQIRYQMYIEALPDAEREKWGETLAHRKIDVEGS